MENNTGNNQGTPEEQGNANGNGELGERTFTQEQVNALIGKKSSEIKAKYADYEDLKAKAKKYDEAQEASKSELQKATGQRDAYKKELDQLKAANSAREIREKVAKEKGIPANLLTKDTEEACSAQADAILAYAKPEGYPNVQDNGEVQHQGKRATRDQFADFMKKL